MAQKKYKEAKSDPKPGDEGYEFPMPDFDEKAFMRREIESAKTNFWTAGIAVAAGVLALLVDLVSPDWRLGWLPILLAMGGLRPILLKLGFSEESTTPKALIGNWFLLFFTALTIWIVGVNL